MKSLLLLALLGLVGAAQAQTDSTSAPARRGLVLKTSPIDLLIPHKTTLWLSAEKQVAPRLGWQLDLGYVLRDDALIDLSDVVNKEFQSTDRGALNVNLKTELRRYLSRRQPALRGFYAAGQLFYKQVHFNSNEAPAYDWYEQVDILGVSSYWTPARRGPESNYQIKLQEKGLHLKMGYQHIGRRGFTVDSFLGLGLRHVRESQSLGQPHPEDSFSGKGGVIPSLALGFKLGYAFR
ncbi:hypothetical protein [Hymenobacter sp. B81]|uniref:hypothetical protein n=1 Tax=Hymenobacter sp. B81 TaxID=3344878 RepID=UPI0037DC2D63